MKFIFAAQLCGHFESAELRVEGGVNQLPLCHVENKSKDGNQSLKSQTSTLCVGGNWLGSLTSSTLWTPLRVKLLNRMMLIEEYVTFVVTDINISESYLCLKTSST